MELAFQLIFIFSLLISFSLHSYAQTCTNYTFSSSKAFISCKDLPQLGASLHWNYTSSTNTINIAFRSPQSSTGWIAWGINPNHTKMVGSQVLVTFQHSNGSMVAFPTVLSSYAPLMDTEELTFPVSDVSAEFVKNEMIIYATLGLVGNNTKLNHVWQEGNTVFNDQPRVHAVIGENIRSFGTIEFQ